MTRRRRKSKNKNNKADINARFGHFGMNALMLALEEQKYPDMERINELLEAGIDVNAIDNVGWTTLMLAVDNESAENPDAIKAMLKAGADPNIQINTPEWPDQMGWTALMLAAKWSKPEIVQALIDGGAEIEITDYKGMTALLWAAAKGSAENVKVLVDAGANVNVKGPHGLTALMMAVMNSNSRVYDYLHDTLWDFRSDEDKLDVAALIAELGTADFTRRGSRDQR